MHEPASDTKRKRPPIRLLVAIAVPFMSLYLCLWPVSIDPVSWKSPQNPINEKQYAATRSLDGARHMPVGESNGPEAVAIDRFGRIYTGVKDGTILRFDTPDAPPVVFAQLPTGRPLGLAFAKNGDLYVAHVPAGLIRVTSDGHSRVVLKTVDNVSIRFADDLDIAKDGTVYLSDATTKFDPQRFGGTLSTSRMDLMEHGGHGRLIEYRPKTAVRRGSSLPAYSLRMGWR